MALSASAIYTMGGAGATTNGGGFNPANANFLTDLAATSATGNSPVVTSAGYTFVAGDTNYWVYIKAGTNWTPGFYQIASVSGGAATLYAAVGEASQFNAATGFWKPNTVAGCATTGSPTGGTYGVDYSQQSSAIHATTDGVSTASTNFTSATGGFTPVLVGNYLYLVSATGADEIITWYEIVDFTDANTLVLDKVSGTYVAGVSNIGGMFSLNGTTADEFMEIALPGNTYFVNARGDSESMSVGEAVSIAADGSDTLPIRVIGQELIHGDNPIDAERPTIACGANAFTFGDAWELYNCIVTGTAATMMASGTECKFLDSKVMNKSTTASRIGLQPGNGALVARCEPICYRGFGTVSATSGSGSYFSNYVHACALRGISLGTASQSVSHNIVADCATIGIRVADTPAAVFIEGNTIYGMENTLGTGIDILTGVTTVRAFNNIIAGWATGILHADAGCRQTLSDYNNFYNNDANFSEVLTGANDTALNPQFTSVTQIAGTAGKFFAGGTTFQDSTKDFTSLGVVANTEQYLCVISGTGATLGYALITAVSTTTNANDTLTCDISIGTNTTTDKVYSIMLGGNFAVGNASLRGTGAPGLFPGGFTTGTNSMGAVIHAASAGSGGNANILRGSVVA